MWTSVEAQRAVKERLIPADWFSPDDGLNRREPQKVERIAASMRAQGGWKGRPLLVEETEHRRLVLWTGSHRIAAAHRVGLREGPCKVISYDVARAALKRLRDQVGYTTLLGALSTRRNGGGMYDVDRLAGLVTLGLDEVADALREEIKAEEW